MNERMEKATQMARKLKNLKITKEAKEKTR